MVDVKVNHTVARRPHVS